MRFCVIGPGAMGCLFAGYLKHAGFDVVLLDRRPERVRVLENRGIRIEGVRGEFRAEVQDFLEPERVGPVDVVLVCVKSYDTRTAAEKIRPLVGRDTLVVTLQNGLGNVEELALALAGRGNVAAGITAQGATVLGPGHIRHAGEGETMLGLPTPDDTSTARRILLEMVDCFQKAGFVTRVADQIHNLIWSKLMVNVGINALTALTRLRNGDLVLHPESEKLLDQAVGEGLQVAEASGVRIVFPDPLAQVKNVCRNTSRNISSMLQDVLNHKKTEIDYINGAIVREGALRGVPTPVNALFTALVRTVQDTYDKQATS